MRPLVTLPGKLTLRLWGLPRWWGDKDTTNWATTMYSSTCCAGGVHDTLAVDEERISTVTFVGESGGAAHWQEINSKWLGSYYIEWTTYKSWLAYWSSKKCLLTKARQKRCTKSLKITAQLHHQRQMWRKLSVGTLPIDNLLHACLWWLGNAEIFRLFVHNFRLVLVNKKVLDEEVIHGRRRHRRRCRRRRRRCYCHCCCQTLLITGQLKKYWRLCIRWETEQREEGLCRT